MAALRRARVDQRARQVDGRDDDPAAQVAQAGVEQLLAGRVRGGLEQVGDRAAGA
jgi:hypothetical protein